ncbi:glycosyltransferase [Spirosoma sp. KNUC1025]|uniref:glycosyltransferase n=1 Tax=Spirosoma sp. KNUC1025 TaxID=2894082 RepID=UPI00386E373F|nr:glycosyltransferase [Spirosoma sp. KNUC1025]
MKKIRVLHVSTAHQPQDPRIVFKQCQTLTELYDVFCAIPHASSSIAHNIHFIRLPYFRRVIYRILLTCPFILLRCIWIRPKLIHVYVPEFLPFAYVFRLLGAKVIYEVQENLHKKMHLKTFNRGYLLEKTFRWFDYLAQRHFYLIFTEHSYLDTYTSVKNRFVIIYNYPLLSFLDPFCRPYQPNSIKPSFFYIGWLSFERAFDTLMSSLVQLKSKYPDFVLHLFGQRTFSQRELDQSSEFKAIRENLYFYGYTDQREAFPYAIQATAGLALLKPVGDYPDSYTTKLFEYMALGLPVITSNFPLYKNVVERHNCGFCVSPTDPAQITQALDFLIEHPEVGYAMGQRGRAAVETEYNWSSEAKKLLGFYESILNSTK